MADRIDIAILEHIVSDEFPGDELPRIARALRAAMVQHARCPKGLDADTPDVCPVCPALTGFEFGESVASEQTTVSPWVRYGLELERQIVKLACSCEVPMPTAKCGPVLLAKQSHRALCDAEDAILAARQAASGEFVL